MGEKWSARKGVGEKMDRRRNGLGVQGGDGRGRGRGAVREWRRSRGSRKEQGDVEKEQRSGGERGEEVNGRQKTVGRGM